MTPITFKVDLKITQELDLVKEEEGLGNRTAAFTFLIKYYFLTKKTSLDQSIELMESLLDRANSEKLPSLEDQLSDI